jgi:hypothetical protein
MQDPLRWKEPATMPAAPIFIDPLATPTADPRLADRLLAHEDADRDTLPRDGHHSRPRLPTHAGGK